jgi:hypothetical protein
VGLGGGDGFVLYGRWIGGELGEWANITYSVLSKHLQCWSVGQLQVPSKTMLVDKLEIPCSRLQLDSLLGATLQETLYSTKDGKILTDLSTRQSRSEPGVKRIGIGRDVLSNSAVNFVSGCAIAAAGWWYATML